MTSNDNVMDMSTATLILMQENAAFYERTEKPAFSYQAVKCGVPAGK